MVRSAIMSMANVALVPAQKESLSDPGLFCGQHEQQSEGSILIYLAVAGSVTPMQVLESDSIASVKLRIQSHKGFFVKNQRLVFDGRELARSNTSIRDYGVTEGTTLHLIIQLSNLQAITVKTMTGKEFEFRIQKNRNVAYLKRRIAQRGTSVFDVKNQELTCDGKELEDQRLVQEYCSRSDAMIHLLVQKPAKLRAKPNDQGFEVSILAPYIDRKESSVGGTREYLPAVKTTEQLGLLEEKVFEDFLLEPFIVNSKIEIPLVIRQLIRSTSGGLVSGNEPIRSSEGSGGAYFMQDSSGQEFVSVFKPLDEEPMAANNPRGLPLSKDGEGLKVGTQVGGGAMREVAAYVLDHPRSGPRLSLDDEGRGFSGVPPTTMVKCLHRGFYHPGGYEGCSKNIKIGSLQKYVKNSGSCEDMGPGAFPVEEVHKISVLDIRLANADRHAGNILITRDDQGQYKLIPIDHGYCLPKHFEDCTFEWLNWPQSRQPYSTETLSYIRTLDAEQDIRLLRHHGWKLPRECTRVLHISTMLLKKGAERGLTPFQIGSIMCRETLKKESLLEQMLHQAQDALLPGTSESAFLETISMIMDRQLDQVSSRKDHD